MAELETLRVKHPTDPKRFTTINKSDYDPEKHELLDGTPAEAAASLYDEFSDDDLADMIETQTGSRPRKNAARASMIATLDELGAENSGL